MKVKNSSQESRNLLNVLTSLPLFDNIFLNMQALNIAIVDDYLEQMEKNLLEEYIEKETTPIPTATLVSALSQMWIFALYELLRTWKQMVSELLAYNETISEIRSDPEFQRKKEKLGGPKKAKFYRPTVSKKVEEAFYDKGFRRIETDESFADILKESLDVVMEAYKSIANLRVTLAKHEIPGARGVKAFATGYSRIDMATGSMYWLIEKENGSSEIISRRSIADSIRDLHVSESG